MELVQEILELGETATWAMKRKDELSQAITSSLDRQNYEEVRDHINEYGLLDDGPEYKALRVELPWRIAGRKIIALRSELEQTRQLIVDKKPGQARIRLADIENSILSLGQLESQYPALKGVLIHEGTPSGLEPGSYAKAVVSLSSSIEQVKLELESIAKSIERLVESATAALQAQDYEGCLKNCADVQRLSLEPSPADALAEKAARQNEQISRFLIRADDALRKGDFASAERAARNVLDRFKRDSFPAINLLDQIRKLQRRRSAGLIALTLLVVTVLYVLSIGPAFRLMLTRKPVSVSTRDTMRTLYQPVYWLHARTALRIPLERYARQWDAVIFDAR
jgi:hypothetical protein